MKPLTTGKPTLMTVANEIVSAVSSLNMPNPRECSPDSVQHAYDHLQMALKQIHQMLSPEGEPSIGMGTDGQTIVLNMEKLIAELHPGGNFRDPKFYASFARKIEEEFRALQGMDTSSPWKEMLQNTVAHTLAHYISEGWFVPAPDEG